MAQTFYNSKEVTVLELLQFVDKNKNNSRHIVNNFLKYTQNDYKAFRALSKPWLQVEVTERALAKMVTDYGGPNASQHKEYFNKLNLTRKNVKSWVQELLEDRCFLPIHSYKMGPRNSLYVCYHIPLAIRPSVYKQKPFAVDSLNFFNTDLVDTVMVIKYSPNKVVLG